MTGRRIAPRFVTGGPPAGRSVRGGWTHEPNPPSGSAVDPDRRRDVTDMCLGFPGLVVAVDPTGATVDSEGRRRRASTLLAPDLQVGEWVFVAAGTVIDRLDPEEAAFIRAHLVAAGALGSDGDPDGARTGGST